MIDWHAVCGEDEQIKFTASYEREAAEFTLSPVISPTEDEMETKAWSVNHSRRNDS